MASDINKDLDKYISSRKEKKDWNFFKPKRQKTHSEPMPQDLSGSSVHVIHHDKKEPSFWQRLFSQPPEAPVSEDLSPEEMNRLERMQEEIEEIDEQEQRHPEQFVELEQERESLIDKFMSLFRGYEKKHVLERKADELEYVEQEVIPKIDEDVKQVLKITHKWLGKLSKRERDNFKESVDYHDYKKILEKYNLVKGKESTHKTAEPEQKKEHDHSKSLHMKGMDDYPILGEK